MTIQELKKLCKLWKIKKYSSLNKKGLEHLVENYKKDILIPKYSDLTKEELIQNIISLDCELILRKNAKINSKKEVSSEHKDKKEISLDYEDEDGMLKTVYLKDIVYISDIYVYPKSNGSEGWYYDIGLSNGEEYEEIEIPYEGDARYYAYRKLAHEYLDVIGTHQTEKKGKITYYDVSLYGRFDDVKEEKYRYIYFL